MSYRALGNIVSMRPRNAVLFHGSSVAWQEHVDADGTVYHQPSGDAQSRAQGGRLSFRFWVDTAFDYFVFFNVRTNSRRGRVRVELDGNTTAVGGGIVELNEATFRWSNSDAGTRVSLYQGWHTLEIISIDAAVQLERVLVLPFANRLVTDGGTQAAPLERFGVLDAVELTHRDGININAPAIMYPLHRGQLDGASQRFTFARNNNILTHPTRWLFRLGTALGEHDVFNGDLNLTDPDDLSVVVDNLPVTNPPTLLYGRLFWRNPDDTEWQYGGREYRFYTSSGIKQQTVAQWLADPSSNAQKILLIELEHAGGTVRLASHPYIDSNNNCFDDWLTDTPFLSQRFGSTLDLGDIVAINPELSEDWRALDWHGYRCRIYVGDRRWQRENFQLVASANIEGCRLSGERQYIFDLVGDSEKYNRTFHTGDDTVQNLTAGEAIDWVLGQWTLSGTYELVNIPAAMLARPLTIPVTSSTTMQDIIDGIARSLNAQTRTAPNGFLEFVRIDFGTNPSVDLNVDNVMGEISMADTIPAVVRVVATYGDGLEVEALTGAATGNVDSAHTIDTYLVNRSDAEAVADEVAQERANTRHSYDVDVLDVGDLVQIGEAITITHSMLMGVGYVAGIRRKPLHDVSTIELVL